MGCAPRFLQAPRLRATVKMAATHSTPMAHATFAVRIDHDEEDGLFYARCLDLQGCHTFGATRTEALERIKEVILDHLQATMAVQPTSKHGTVPPGSEIVEIVA